MYPSSSMSKARRMMDFSCPYPYPNMPTMRQDLRFGTSTMYTPLKFSIMLPNPSILAKQVKRKRPLIDFWKQEVFNSDRRISLKKSKSVAAKACCKLKRLQRQYSWKLNRSSRNTETCHRTARKIARNDLQVSRGIRASSPPVCPLWNCPKKSRIRREGFKIKRWRSRASVLSDLSRRSRTPITTMRDSPLLDARGFEIQEY